jgi:hypothetical protein
MFVLRAQMSIVASMIKVDFQPFLKFLSFFDLLICNAGRCND